MIIARLHIAVRGDDIREDAIEIRFRHPPSRIRRDDFNDCVHGERLDNVSVEAEPRRRISYSWFHEFPLNVYDSSGGITVY